MTRTGRHVTAKLGATRWIVLQCVFGYILSAAALTALESASVSAKVDTEISERVLSLEDRVEQVLEQALWNLDLDLVKMILSGVVDDPAIKRVELRDMDGIVTMSLEAKEDIPETHAGDGYPMVFRLSHESPIRVEYPIGSLTVYSSLRLRRVRIRETVLYSAERTAILIFLLSVILSITIERGLGRPLRDLARRISEVDPSDPGGKPIAPRGSSADELSLVADAFNAMSVKMSETMAALVESSARLWSAFDDSPISLWEEDFSLLKDRLDEEREEGIQNWQSFFASPERVIEFSRLIRVIDVNRSTLSLIGEPDKGVFLESFPAPIQDDVIEALRSELVFLASGSSFWEGEMSVQTTDGRTVALQVRLRIVPGFEKSWGRVLVSLVDISDLKRAELVLKRSLEEKELLLKEVHHRVKNNLQIICSLINMQYSSADSYSDTKMALLDSKSRIWSMALVHELIYENQDFASIDFSSYVRKLCHQDVSFFGDAFERIQVLVDVRNDVRLSLEKAIPCGLLINELIVNSVNHAFPDGREGMISVSMERTRPGDVLLLYRDDGVSDISGMHKAGSMGLMLVKGLVEQLGGTISLDDSCGFRAELSFPATMGA